MTMDAIEWGAEMSPAFDSSEDSPLHRYMALSARAAA